MRSLAHRRIGWGGQHDLQEGAGGRRFGRREVEGQHGGHVDSGAGERSCRDAEPVDGEGHACAAHGAWDEQWTECKVHGVGACILCDPEPHRGR